MTNREREIFWKRTVCQWSYQDFLVPRSEPDQAVVAQRNRQFFSALFAQLESFLDELVSDKAIPFVPRVCTKRGGAYDFTPLAERYFHQIPSFLKVVEDLPSQNRYSEHLEAFIACCRDMGLFGQTLEWGDIWEAPR